MEPGALYRSLYSLSVECDQLPLPPRYLEDVLSGMKNLMDRVMNVPNQLSQDQQWLTDLQPEDRCRIEQLLGYPRAVFDNEICANVDANDNTARGHPLSESTNFLDHIDLTLGVENLMIAAARKGHLPLVKALIEIGADPNAKEKDCYGWGALHWACDGGHADVVHYLLGHGADVDAQDPSGWTGLILSSRRGTINVVSELLDHGADINKVTDNQWSALMWTAQEGHAEVARLLLERRAATTQDEDGFTPLLQASQDGHLGVVKALVEHDPEMDLDMATKRGWTAIMLATKNGHEDIVRYLVEKGSDVNYQKEDKITALHIAAFKGHNSIVRYFCLAQKMEGDIQDKDGITPLMFAVKQGRVVVVRTLVENGRADVNIKENAFEWTALFFAVNERRPEVLDYLLRSGRVNVNHVDDLGHSIVDLARKVNPDALEYLSTYHKAETETMTRAPPKQFTMAPYQVMLDRVSRTIGDNMDIKAREVQVAAA